VLRNYDKSAAQIQPSNDIVIAAGEGPESGGLEAPRSGLRP
jgi:hypothetical protein